MKANYETGYAKNIANFEKLVTKCTSFGARYQPAYPELIIDALNKQHDAATKDFDDFLTAKRMATADGNQRRVFFNDMKKLGTRIVNALASAGTSKETMTNARSILRKIRGVRANTDAPATTPATDPALPAKKKNSVSQQSFDLLIQHFTTLLELLASEAKYKPNEADLTVAALQQYKQEMKVFNKQAGISEANLEAAMNKRDTALFHTATGIVPIALRVKNYVVSVFGAGSPEARQTDRLNFRSKNF